MLNPTQSQVLQHCVRREALSSVSENSPVTVEWLGSVWAFCMTSAHDRWNLNNKAYPKLIHCIQMQCGSLFLLWDKFCSLVPVVNFGAFNGTCHLEKTLEKDSPGSRANWCPPLLTTKRWVFENNQSRFQWHLTLSLCIVKQTDKTPLVPASPLLIYKGGNFQEVLAVDNKAFFKNTLRVSKTTFEMSNIF